MITRNDATEAQVRAADPTASTWLSANAGSGKTRVLTDRVARLLLEGVEPQRILCLTYTKAAASEMQNRLFKRLGAWAMMDETALITQLQELGVERSIDFETVRQARRLFARAIETPGGLKIQTIHSFCASLLRRFPLEAGVSPQFTEMEDRAAEMLRADVVDQMARGIHADRVALLAKHFTGADLSSLTDEISRNSAMFETEIDEKTLSQAFGVTQTDSLDQALKDVFLGSENALFQDILPHLIAGSKTDAKSAITLTGLIDSPPNLAMLTALEKLFLTGAGAKQPFSAKIGSFPTKATQSKIEASLPELHDLMQRVEEIRPRRLALVARERTRALHTFSHVFVTEYEREKLRRGWLDFDDLILKARALLTDPLVAQWVLFRLDGGIDHILVDEAQDTSPAQWDVVENLAQDFTSGQGAFADRHRTLFVVGDKKQSIYSFQGADPRAFDEKRDLFAQRLNQIEIALNSMVLEYSFRSAAPILRVVDTWLADSGVERDVFHRPFNHDLPGRVDVWPAIEPVKPEEGRKWSDPVDTVGSNHHSLQLAEQIADQIDRMIRHETIPFDDNGTLRRRPVHAGDVLILVQRRSDLFAEIIRACKAKGLAIAGTDRLKVGAELAVRDIKALLAFLALPEDDLSLAATLRSPLFGWSEQDLYDLAHKRAPKSYLWAELRRRSDDFPDTMAIIRDLEKQADYFRPYDLIERLLTRHEGRERLLARLGAEAEDGINALLTQALAYERSDIPSLTGFLSWMETDAFEIKRQMESAGDKIRVMTVHGAKGLEAPIVILPDTAKRPYRVHDDILKTDKTAIWRTPADQSPAEIQALMAERMEREKQERQRLLYVAMTRAEKWLITCAAGDVGEKGDSWYADISAAVEDAGGDIFDHPHGQGLRFADGNWDGLELKEPMTTTETLEPLPTFARTHAAPPLEQVKTLAPSDLGGAKIIGGDIDGAPLEDSLRKGRMIHLLLEHLPKCPRKDWKEYASALLLNGPEQANSAELETYLAQATDILTAPHLAHIFADDALAEVDITASLSELNGARIHGAIDRLILNNTKILAVDFKSNATVPDHPKDVPEGLLRQMGAYHTGLAQIYPDHQIDVAILWTETAHLMPLPHDLVSQALKNTTSA